MSATAPTHLRDAHPQARVLEDIHDALREDRLRLHAQPIVDLASGRLVKEELLIRMVERDGSLRAPGTFLPVAEAHDVIVDLDCWVIRRAVELAAEGRALAINLSARSVGREVVARTVEEALARTGADPSLLTFEVTETALTDDIESAARFTNRLAALGCDLSLDDFGTGYGTLTYLKTLPVSTIKIDVEFVRDMTTNPNSRKIVEAVVGIAASFGLQAVAEGVEDEDTLDLLREHGVQSAQGYHIARPAPLGRGAETRRFVGDGSVRTQARLRDSARLAALVATGRLDAPADPALDRLTETVAWMLEVPVAVITLVDCDRQFFASADGLTGWPAEDRKTPLSHSFCQHAVASGRPFVVADAREHPLVAQNLAVAELGVIAYAGVPLVDGEGQALGAICAIDARPRQWTPEHVGALQVLASHATRVLTGAS